MGSAAGMANHLQCMNTKWLERVTNCVAYMQAIDTPPQEAMTGPEREGPQTL